MVKSTTIIAFNHHAATTVAAVLLPGHRTPALQSLSSDIPTIQRFVARVQRQGPVTCCYEAGPCGFELQRALTARRMPCEVIAPALIPRRAGDRIKTDRRDAGQLAILHRAGCVNPHPHSERAGRSRPRSAALSRRHPRRFAPRPSPALQIPAPPRPSIHRHEEGLVQAPLRLAACSDVAACPPSTRRIGPICARSTRRAPDSATIEQELRALLDLEPLRTRAVRLRCFRGIDDLTALTIAAELGDPRRFATAPRTDGLSSASSRRSTRAAPHGRQGAITKTGNAHLRRVLVESAWHYRHHPFVSADAARPSAWGAPRMSLRRPGRRNSAFIDATQRFAARGKRKQHIVTAVARELTGFVWAALTQ